MTPEKPKKIDLRTIFLGLQDQMIASLSATREIIQHPGTKGDASELHWLGMLSTYLPERYQVDKAFVLDCDGNISDQIDVVIYDQQYSPFLFNQNFAKYVPAESVYAVFEVRQYLSAVNIKYAGGKAASVRSLRRTSAVIRHAGGKHEPIQPQPIIAGVLALDSEWTPSFGDPFHSALNDLTPEEHLDLGCALRCGGFEVEYPQDTSPKASVSKPEAALVYFFFKLLAQLQRRGTVAAIDLGEYGRVL